ncbi:MAG TPA: TIGR04076 family protein [Steroidobacteraceae bacterium]
MKTKVPDPTAPLQAGGPGDRAGAAPGPGFELYDLRVEVVSPADRTIYCGAKPGDYFELHGEMLKLPTGQGFSIYSLAALLPLLPAKQRVTDPNDWMSSDAEVACPDPNCPTRFRITRTGRRYFKRSDVTAVPLATQSPSLQGIPAVAPRSAESWANPK